MESAPTIPAYLLCNILMRYLAMNEVLLLHRRIIAQSGGMTGVRDLGALESALAQPRATFAGDDLYPTLTGKVAVLGFSLIMNHPFMDGNKRVGHAAMETFLMLNGHEIAAGIDEQELVILAVAAGETERAEFTGWVEGHVQAKR